MHEFIGEVARQPDLRKIVKFGDISAAFKSKVFDFSGREFPLRFGSTSSTT